jgi:hypothetical protein
VEDLIAKLDTTFAIASCLSTNTISGVECYIDSGAFRNMTVNISAFFKLEEQDTSMQVEPSEPSDDGKYLISGLCSISFRMLAEVLELQEELYVPSMTKNLLLVSCLTDLNCMVEFDDQGVIIKSRSPDPSRVLARAVREGGLYRLLASVDFINCYPPSCTRMDLQLSRQS